MEKKENGEVIFTDAEIKSVVNKAYTDGAYEMAKQLKNVIEADFDSFKAAVIAQFEEVMKKLPHKDTDKEGV